MIRLFIFLILLVGAVLLGLLIKAEPGYMLIAYKHWTIEMPLWFGILGIIVSFWILYWIVKFLAVTFGLPDRVRFWSGRRRLRKAQHKTNQGLIALAEGNWLVAEKYLAHGARISDTPLINYLAAARAAQARGAYDRRDYYLRQAHVVNPEAEIAVGLTQAQLQLEHHQLEQALATIMHVRTLVPNHKFVLQLLQELYLSLNDWQSLEKLLSSLQKYKILSSENLEKLTIQVYENLLKQAGLKKYQEVWHTVPRYLHIQPCLVLIYVDYLIQEKNTHQAEMLLREALKKNWDEYLLLRYCEVKDNSAKQLANAEHWLRTHADDANLLYVVGQLSIANELWGKARSYFEESLAIKPSSRSYQALAALLETIEDTKEAIKYYRQALLYCREEK